MGAAEESNSDRHASIAMLRRGFEEFLAVPTAIIAGFVVRRVPVAHGRSCASRVARAPAEVRRVARVQRAAGDEQPPLGDRERDGDRDLDHDHGPAHRRAAERDDADGCVYDQFLRRRYNQFYFGFFIGLALYTLTTLATVNQAFNPVFGATLVLVLTMVALYLLVLLLYSTINQMRPVEIIGMIRSHVLSARER